MLHYIWFIKTRILSERSLWFCCARMTFVDFLHQNCKSLEMEILRKALNFRSFLYFKVVAARLCPVAHGSESQRACPIEGMFLFCVGALEVWLCIGGCWFIKYESIWLFVDFSHTLIGHKLFENRWFCNSAFYIAENKEVCSLLALKCFLSCIYRVSCETAL